MVDNTVIVAALGVAGGLAGGPIWGAIADVLKIGNLSHRTQLKELRAQNEECEKKYRVLEKRLNALEHSRDSQFARWIKDRNGSIVWMNAKAFLMIFAPLGFSREELTAKTFRELFDPGTAGEIENLEYAALTNPGVAQNILIQLHPSLPFLNVVKVAYVGAQNEVQYEGIAFQPGDPEIRHSAGVRRQVQQITASAVHLIDNAEPEDFDPV